MQQRLLAKSSVQVPRRKNLNIKNRKRFQLVQAPWDDFPSLDVAAHCITYASHETTDYVRRKARHAVKATLVIIMTLLPIGPQKRASLDLKPRSPSLAGEFYGIPPCAFTDTTCYHLAVG